MKKLFLIFSLLCINNVHPVSYKLSLDEYEAGFFSVFNLVLGTFDFYEKAHCTGLTIDFEDRGFYHDSDLGDNWWGYYFENPSIGMISGNELKFSQSKKVEMSLYASLKMPRIRGHELIQKYLKLKPHIQEKVDSFVKQNFYESYVIGIHYRGTDKLNEAPSYTYIFNLINQKIKDLIENDHTLDAIKIFVATDDQKFLSEIQKQFPHKVVSWEAIRSSNGSAVHYPIDKDAYKKGEDALIDCILLSNCSMLFKPESNLSNAATKFNPTMPVVELNPHVTNYYLNHAR